MIGRLNRAKQGNGQIGHTLAFFSSFCRVTLTAVATAPCTPDYPPDHMELLWLPPTTSVHARRAKAVNRRTVIDHQK